MMFVQTSVYTAMANVGDSVRCAASDSCPARRTQHAQLLVFHSDSVDDVESGTLYCDWKWRALRDGDNERQCAAE